MTIYKPSVAILMSTFNGENYLREQIDSILHQKNVQVNLFIRDDGSEDSTISILTEYASIHNNFTLFLNEGNIGPGKSFMSLFYRMKDTKYDYYAFADQDDVWLDDKLISAIKKIEEHLTIYPNKPVLYSSNQILYQDGKKMGLRYSKPQDTTLISHIDSNMISGCTFVFNRSLQELINKAPHPSDDLINRRMHDAWIMLCAIICGDVIYDENAYILYRIHGDNVVGVRKLSLKEKLEVKKRNLLDNHFSNYRKRTAEQLLKCFPEVSGKDRETLEKYAYYQDSFKQKKRLMDDAEIIDSFASNKFISKLKILFNLV